MGELAVATERAAGRAIAGAEEDARAIAAIRARDVGAFEALYRAQHARLARFLLGITHRPTIVEEVLNETMLAVWEKPDGFRGASRLSTWIMAIAYRKAMRALRRQDLPIEGRPVEEAAEDGPDREAEARRAGRLLVAAMARLSPDHRAVIDLTYFHELGCREIAEIMGCPVDTVKTRMFHARRRLRGMLAGTAADWL